MKLPAPVRYLPARLKPLVNPLVLVPVSVAALMAVLIWDYGRDPSQSEWNEPAENTLGAADADELGLPPEGDVETLGLLLNEPQGSLNSLTAEPEADGTLSATPTDSATASSATPFDSYLEQYRFGGRSARADSTQLPSASPLSLPSAQSRTAAEPVRESPLSSALLRLRGSSAATAEAAASPDLADALADTAGAPSGTPIDQSNITPGTLPGSPNTSFIRTVPSMSPPPGTTGYRPPASLNFSIYDQSLGRTPSGASAFPGYSSSPAGAFEFNRPAANSSVLPGAVQAPAPAFAPPTVPTETAQPAQQPRNGWDGFWGN